MIQSLKTKEQKGKRRASSWMEWWKQVYIVFGTCVQSKIHCSVFTSPHGQRSAHSQVSTKVLWTPVPSPSTHTQTNATTIIYTDMHVHTLPDTVIYPPMCLYTQLSEEQGPSWLDVRGINELPFSSETLIQPDFFTQTVISLYDLVLHNQSKNGAGTYSRANYIMYKPGSMISTSAKMFPWILQFKSCTIQGSTQGFRCLDTTL